MVLQFKSKDVVAGTSAAHPSRIACFTIASNNYISYVRVLLDSVQRANPDFRRYLCLADLPDERIALTDESFETVSANSIGIPDFDDFAFRYDIMEFNTAVKPYMFAWLFENTDVDAVIYLDPDVYCFADFGDVLRLIAEGASVIATPHLTSPLEDGQRPNDSHLLQAGVFNLGFLTVARSEESSRFLSWWGRRMTSQCLNAISENLFVDQKWCDLLPCYVDRLAVLRHPGYNVAYWNLSERILSETTDGNILCNSQPLRFFHFSGIDPANPTVLSKHQDRHQLSSLPVVRRLVEDYIDKVLRAGWKTTRTMRFAYGRFSDDTPVSDVIRKTYRRRFSPGEFTGCSPFDIGAAAICNVVSPDVVTIPGMPITCLMHEVYLLRPDVRAHFSLDDPSSRRRYVNWFEASAQEEYGLPGSVVFPSRARIDSGDNSSPTVDWTGDSNRSRLRRRVDIYRRLVLFEQVARRHRSLLPRRLRDWLRQHWSHLKKRLLQGF